MDERNLQVFVAVAEELSVTHAAARLRAAQSTVSASLRSLERELGSTLFERTTRSMRLTAAGERALDAAREVLAAAERLRGEARDTGESLRGRVRVGLFPALEALEMPAAAAAFQERHPDVELQLTSSPSGSTGLHDDVRHGRLDLAFSALPRLTGLGSRLLDELPLVAVLPAGHPLAERPDEPLALEVLAEERWIDTLPGYANRVLIELALSQAGVGRRVVAEVGDLPSVVAFVRAGAGVAVLPTALPMEGCVTRPLLGEVPSWRLSLIWRADVALSAAATAFREEVVRQHRRRAEKRDGWLPG